MSPGYNMSDVCNMKLCGIIQNRITAFFVQWSCAILWLGRSVEVSGGNSCVVAVLSSPATLSIFTVLDVFFLRLEPRQIRTWKRYTF